MNVRQFPPELQHALVVRPGPRGRHVRVRLIPIHERQESPEPIEDFVRERQEVPELFRSLSHDGHVTLNQRLQRITCGNGVAVMVGCSPCSHSRLQVLNELRFKAGRGQPWSEWVGEKLFPHGAIERRRPAERLLKGFLGRVHTEEADGSRAVELRADGVAIRNGVIQGLDGAVVRRRMPITARGLPSLRVKNVVAMCRLNQMVTLEGLSYLGEPTEVLTLDGGASLGTTL